uniref:Uncharacterized protein n=1 Tax=Arundo donax TaxID=35708 RepID=A0A0A9ERN6_ARUDO
MRGPPTTTRRPGCCF